MSSVYFYVLLFYWSIAWVLVFCLDLPLREIKSLVMYSRCFEWKTSWALFPSRQAELLFDSFIIVLVLARNALRSSAIILQIWETATGKLKLTLTGHIEQIRGQRCEWCLLHFGRIIYFVIKFEPSLLHFSFLWAGLAVSPRHPYLFSAGDDKQVKCWDLEYNKVSLFISSCRGCLEICFTLTPW